MVFKSDFSPTLVKAISALVPSVLDNEDIKELPAPLFHLAECIIAVRHLLDPML